MTSKLLPSNLSQEAEKALVSSKDKCARLQEELVRQQMHLFISYNLLGQQHANNQLGMMERPQAVRIGRSLY